MLEAIDKYGNKLDRGGARIDARANGPGVSACVSDDRGDGTYIISFTAAVVGETRVIVRLDNVEMQPLRMVFVEQKEAHAVSTDGTTKRAKSKSGAQDRVIEESQPNATAPAAAAAVATNLSKID